MHLNKGAKMAVYHMILRSGLQHQMETIRVRSQHEFKAILRTYNRLKLLEMVFILILASIAMFLVIPSTTWMAAVLLTFIILSVFIQTGLSPSGYLIVSKVHRLRVATATSRIAVVNYMFNDTEHERKVRPLTSLPVVARVPILVSSAGQQALKTYETGINSWTTDSEKWSPGIRVSE